MDRKQRLKELNEDIKLKLERIGDKLGFKSKKEWNIENGRVDFVWYKDLQTELPKYWSSKIPIVGFEIESSWRTSKHIKGDIMSLLNLSPSLGVVIFVEEGFATGGQYNKEKDSKANVKFAEKQVRGFSSLLNLLIWTENDVNKLYNLLINKRKN